MALLYILLIAYILSINFYAYLLVKSSRDKEREEQAREIAIHSTVSPSKEEQTPIAGKEKISGKLYITGVLGGAITIYLCLFLLKYRRSDLLLMVVMPLLGVLNIYLWVLLFRSGFSFFIIR